MLKICTTASKTDPRMGTWGRALVQGEFILIRLRMARS